MDNNKITNTMSVLDENKEQIPENLYLELCNSLKEDFNVIEEEEKNKLILCKLTFLKVEIIYKGEDYDAIPYIDSRLVKIPTEMFEIFNSSIGSYNLNQRTWTNDQCKWFAENNLQLLNTDYTRLTQLYVEKSNCCSDEDEDERKSLYISCKTKLVSIVKEE